MKSNKNKFSVKKWETKFFRSFFVSGALKRKQQNYTNRKWTYERMFYDEGSNRFISEGTKAKVYKLLNDAKKEPKNAKYYTNKVNRLIKYELRLSGLEMGTLSKKEQKERIMSGKQPVNVSAKIFSRGQLRYASRFVTLDTSIEQMYDALQRAYKNDSEFLIQIQGSTEAISDSYNRMREDYFDAVENGSLTLEEQFKEMEQERQKSGISDMELIVRIENLVEKALKGKMNIFEAKDKLLPFTERLKRDIVMNNFYGTMEFIQKNEVFLQLYKEVIEKEKMDIVKIEDILKREGII